MGYDWGEISDILNESVEILKKHIVILIIATIIFYGLSMLLIPFAPLLLGLYIMILAAIRGEELKITDIFKGFDRFWTSWGISILVFLAVVIGFALLFIPGLFMMVLLLFPFAVAVNENTGAIDSIKRSYNLAKDNFSFTWRIALIVYALSFGAAVSEILIILLTPLTLIIETLAYLKLAAKEGAA